MATPKLTTERLMLRPIKEEDTLAIFQCWMQDEEVSRYMCWKASDNIDDTKDFVSFELGNIENKHWNRWIVLLNEPQIIIGTCLLFFNNQEDCWDISYNLGKKFWKNGYMTEAMQEVMRYGTGVLHIHEFIAAHAIENSASRRIIEKLGFYFEKEIPYVCGGGELRTTGRYYRYQTDQRSLFKSTLNTRPLIADSFRYIRSDVPDHLSIEEVRWMIRNNVVTIVDLRDTEEMEKRPCPLMKQTEFTYFHLPVTGGNTIPSSSAEVGNSYIAMVDHAMREIIHTIEQAGTNVLFFCNAGKDRTGVVSAILLSRMGIPRERIIEDYMESAENLKEMLQEYASNHKEVNLEVITPKKSYIEALLDYL